MSGVPHTGYGHCTCVSHVDRPWNRPEHWSDKDVSYLEAHYGWTPDATMVAHLGRSYGAIKSKAHKLGVFKRDRAMSARQLGFELGVDSKVIGTWCVQGLICGTRRGARKGHGLAWMIPEGSINRFVREYPHYLDVEKMLKGPWRDQVIAAGRWYTLAELIPLTGRHPHRMNEEIKAGRWEARRRGIKWVIHESRVPAIAASVYQTRASPERYVAMLERCRNRRKGVA